MLKHITNGGVANRGTRPDSSMIMEPRDQQSHRFRSPNANSSRISTQQYPLNVTQLHNVTPNLDNSKHSIYSNAAVLSTGNKVLNGGLNISRIRNQSTVNKFIAKSKQVGVKEMLVSLGLLCLVSLLLALLSLIFLLKISPVTANDIRELLRAEQLTVITAEEYVVVYEVTLALCALTLSLNLCCLLVCAIQFLFAVKLVKSPHGGSDRTNKYLQKSSISRVCAVGGFFISIPVFLTGIILYTFIQFHSTPAIVTSVFIGLGIIFCGCAMVHNVFIWQREKTNAVKELALQHDTTQQHYNSFHSITSQPLQTNLNQSYVSNFNQSFGHPLASIHSNGPYIIRPSTTTPPSGENLNISKHPREASGSVSPGMPTNTIDISSVATTNSPHELSTLV
ncbi:uncharacterized protein LOC115882341 [Sitophilus oryzae]|uniref:Uncharacterized protein LOC115882341 n=1 Tax=Sitophilus oryzae TaxID=7048 RepID=A0A6J2XXI1_SITOR|nr:uncharacterized protein LOC115882341 [Sitophilus oryzae]XP_030756224.1 uncharacterized protein LOC115882341 [Sitophilus oryzae]XP_030756225.1 uncharacterized protein LOC115882341 [Sitophilus oryzae]